MGALTTLTTRLLTRPLGKEAARAPVEPTPARLASTAALDCTANDWPGLRTFAAELEVEVEVGLELEAEAGLESLAADNTLAAGCRLVSRRPPAACAKAPAESLAADAADDSRRDPRFDPC